MLHYIGIKVPDDYYGYIPAVHGAYDANAHYAKWHEQKRAEEAAQASQADATGPGGTASYESTMALNRFTGHAQRAGLGPERHSDSAKASRQMNAFFDPEAAANAHDGRSLKEERKNQVPSKRQIQEYNRANREKKVRKLREKWT